MGVQSRADLAVLLTVAVQGRAELAVLLTVAVQGRAELAVLLTVAELAVFTVDSCQWLYKVLLSWPYCAGLGLAVLSVDSG